MLEHIPCAFFWGEGFDESDAGNAGIQTSLTHAPCWNQVKMCVQINFFPSTCCVFRAGTQYFFNRNQRYHECEISVKKILDFSGQRMLKIAGSVDKSGKQVVKTPRVLTPRC